MSTNLLSTVNVVRAKYGATMSDDECADLCNEVAWIHRLEPEKWGVSLKEAGTHGTRHDGTRICHDVVMRGDTKEGFDCLVAAGAASVPTWNSVGVITDPSRRWVAPIAPETTTEPPKPPPPPPIKPKAQFSQEFTAVNQYYMSMAGLQRPGGMVLNGQADVAGMIEWGYQLVSGATLESVIAQITASDEWKQKHGRG